MTELVVRDLNVQIFLFVCFYCRSKRALKGNFAKIKSVNLLNQEYILKNVGKQTFLEPIDFRYIWTKKNKHIFQKIIFYLSQK